MEPTREQIEKMKELIIRLLEDQEGVKIEILDTGDKTA